MGVDDGQGGLVCCSPWGRKESDTTEQLKNWTRTTILFSHQVFMRMTGSRIRENALCGAGLEKGNTHLCKKDIWWFPILPHGLSGKQCVCIFSHGWLFVTPWTVANQVSLPIEFSRQEYCSGLPFPTPEDLPNPGIKRWQLKHLIQRLSSYFCSLTKAAELLPQLRQFSIMCVLELTDSPKNTHFFHLILQSPFPS